MKTYNENENADVKLFNFIVLQQAIKSVSLM